MHKQYLSILARSRIKNYIPEDMKITILVQDFLVNKIINLSQFFLQMYEGRKEDF